MDYLNNSFRAGPNSDFDRAFYASEALGVSQMSGAGPFGDYRGNTSRR